MPQISFYKREWFWMACFGVLVVVSKYFHEPWQDEGDSWNLVQELSFYQLISEQLSIIGHPALWYVVLMPFAKLGFPFVTMLIIHWLLSMWAAWLLMYRSPFPLLIKLGVLFSFTLSYQYAVISRSYILIFIFLFCALSLFNKRREHPFKYALSLALLLQTHVFAAGMVLGLVLIDVLYFFKEQKFEKFEAIMMCLLGVSGLFLLYEFWPHPDRICYNQPLCSGLYKEASFWSELFGKSIKSFFYGVYAYNSLPNSLIYSKLLAPIIIIPGTAISIAITFKLMKNVNVRIFFFCGLIWIFFIFGFVYSGNPRHLPVIFVVFVGALWLYLMFNSNFLARKKRLVALYFIFFLQLAASANAHITDIRRTFSGLERVAHFIISNEKYHDYIVLTKNFAHLGGVAPHFVDHNLNIKFYNDCLGFYRYNTFNNLGHECLSLSFDDFMKRHNSFLQNNDKVLLVLASAHVLSGPDKNELIVSRDIESKKRLEKYGKVLLKVPSIQDTFYVVKLSSGS